MIIVSQMPIRNAPITAPGMEPMPPNTAAKMCIRDRQKRGDAGGADGHLFAEFLGMDRRLVGGEIVQNEQLSLQDGGDVRTYYFVEQSTACALPYTTLLFLGEGCVWADIPHGITLNFQDMPTLKAAVETDPRQFLICE